jgi:choice-of-anchor A domain-containing protein
VDISPANASLTIYMAGSSFKTAGNAGLNNLSKNPIALALYGLPTCTSIDLGGNAALSGTVYAPQAAFSLGGGGNNTYDFVGASISKTVTMNGHFNFHYDENIARVGPSRGYVATSWAEK